MHPTAAFLEPAAFPMRRRYYRLETIACAAPEVYRDLEGGVWRLARRID